MGFTDGPLDGPSDFDPTKLLIKLDGTLLNDGADKDALILSNIETKVSCGPEASICEVVLYARRQAAAKNKEFSDIKVGKKIKIEIKKSIISTEEVFVGYLFSFSIEIAQDVQILTLMGMDAKMWLMSSKNTKQFEGKKKYSDIVKQIGQSHPKVTIGTVTITGEVNLSEPINQIDQSDYDFLCYIAEITGCFFYFEFDELFFKNYDKTKGTSVTVTEKLQIKNVKYTANTLGMLKSAKVIGVNMDNFSEPIEGTESTGTTLGGGEPATECVSTFSSSANVLLTTVPNVKSPEEAAFYAKALLNKRKIRFVNCVLTVDFNYKLKLLSKITIRCFGDFIDGNYIISAINHIYNAEERITTLSLISTGINVPSGFSLSF
ncbi:MAG: hypothetical protein NkDv07_0986 [Candidatus Improbicoccus devescovinae]|nr:MAG: hypothetical protein NkDv07_0986 [Candidatus Improbicoccus devescovinae]